MSFPLRATQTYTIDDIYALPEGKRAELIDGQIYMMAPPNRTHQTIARELFTSINSYIKSKGGSCETFFAPFAVFLNQDKKNYVEPDISVICDLGKLDDKGCNGAPDWVIEIVSPSSRRMDYHAKLFKYRTAGVREYWIVDSEKDRILVYNFETEDTGDFTFQDSVKAGIFDDLYLNFSDIGKLLATQTYTINDIYALPEGKRAELIDGQLYMMAPPTRIHQEIISGLHYKIRSFFESSKGSCRVYPAPFAVFLNQDKKNYVEPDISVICDLGKLDDRGCNGAPDWVVEVASPGTKRMDYGIKLFKYHAAGVREYWIINPMMKTVNVYDWEHDDEKTNQYSFHEDIPSCIHNGFSIGLDELLP